MDRSLANALRCDASRWNIRAVHFEPPPLYFMHISKTAGLALGKYLKGIYATPDLLHIGEPGQLMRENLVTLRGYHCYHCHYGWGLYELVRRPDLLRVTLLRDPVERTISHIYHQQRILVSHPHVFTPDYRERMQPFIQADLRTCLQEPGFFNIIDNWQTHTLGIARDYRPYLQDGRIGAKGGQILEPDHAAPLTEAQTMAQIVTTVKQRLDTFAIVGLTERFADVIVLLSDRLGIQPPTQVPIFHVGLKRQNGEIRSYRTTTPPDLIEQIEAWNRYDLELYAYACDLFEQQLARHRAQPQRSYSIAPRLRQQVKHWLPLAKKVTRRFAPWLARSKRRKQLSRRSVWFKIP